MKNNDKALMEKGWRQMKAILDKELPTEQHRPRVGGYWWLVASLFLAGAVTFICLRQMPTNVQQPGIAALEPEMVLLQEQTQNQAHIQAVKELSAATIVHNIQPATQSQPLNSLPELSKNLSSGQESGVTSQVSSISHDAPPTQELNHSLTAPGVPGSIQVNHDAVPSLTTANLPEQVHSKQFAQVLLPTKPIAIASNKPKWQMGLGTALGSSLLPNPSSVQLYADARYNLKANLQVGVSLGAQYSSFKGNQTVLVEIPKSVLDYTTASPAVVDYLNAKAAEGQYPKLTKAVYYLAGASIRQQLSTYLFGGLSIQYLHLQNAQVSGSNIGADHNGSLALLDPGLHIDLTNTLKDVGSQILAKNSLAVQAEISRQINRDFQVNLGLRALLTKGYPDPMSVQLGCVYSPLHF